MPLSVTTPVAFWWTLAGSGITSNNNQGIWSEGSGALALVALQNTQAPDTPNGALFDQFLGPTIDANGKTAFWASLKVGGGGVSANNDSGIWSERTGTLALVAREGSQAPGLSPGVNFAGFRNFTRSLTVNALGRMAFPASLQAGTGNVDASNDSGIWSDGSGIMDLLVREGGQAPGTPAGVVFGDFAVNVPVINSSGKVAFSATLTGSGVTTSNDTGLFATDRLGRLKLIARKGDLYQVAPGDVRTISFVGYNQYSGGVDGSIMSFNDSFTLPYRLQFTDGTEGEFTATLVSTPTTGVSSWENGLEGWHVPGFANRPVNLQQSNSGTTDGLHSLAVTQAGSGFCWDAGIALSGDALSAFSLALSDNRADYRLEFDVTYDTNFIPQGTDLTFLNESIAISDAAGNWSQVDSVGFATGHTNETVHVAIPLTSWNSLAAGSSTYNIYFGINGDWGSLPATVFFDDLRLVNLTAQLGGDYNDDGKVDASDYVLWRNEHGSQAGYDTWREHFGQTAGSNATIGATVPEPATVALCAVSLCALLFRPIRAPCHGPALVRRDSTRQTFVFSQCPQNREPDLFGLIPHGNDRLVIWTFTDSLANKDHLTWYPGDDVVDMIGLDIYTDPASTMSGQWYDILAQYNGRKLVALSETGTLPNAAAMSTYNIGWDYFSVWQDSFLDDFTAQQVQTLLNDSRIITLNELPNLPWSNSAPVLGDFDHNGQVDAADYVLWRNSRGQSGLNLAADGNLDGHVDDADYAMWKSHFGQTSSLAAGMSVPEPAIGMIAWASLIAYTWRHRLRIAYCERN